MSNSITNYCNRCKTNKDVGSFHKNKKAKNGLNNWCKQCYKEYQQQYLQRQSSKRSNSSRQLERLYGISIDDYDKMLKKQGGVCMICGSAPGKKRLHVDHDHTTGAVRGLLCHGCNVALGSVREDVSVLHKMIEYLRRFSAWQDAPA